MKIEYRVNTGITPSLVIHQDSRKVDGLGGEIWNGAYVLARYMEQNAPALQHTDVIELGSGCGLCGLVAAALGTHSVVLTDEYPDLLEINIHQNRRVLDSKVDWAVLDWENKTPPVMTHRFDIAIGSEITQLGRDLHLPLLQTIKQVLKPPPSPSMAFLSMDTCAASDCCAECPRETSSCVASHFVRTAKALGFAVDMVDKVILAQQQDCQNHIGVNGTGTIVDEDDCSAVFRLRWTNDAG